VRGSNPPSSRPSPAGARSCSCPVRRGSGRRGSRRTSSACPASRSCAARQRRAGPHTARWSSLCAPISARHPRRHLASVPSAPISRSSCRSSATPSTRAIGRPSSRRSAARSSPSPRMAQRRFSSTTSSGPTMRRSSSSLRSLPRSGTCRSSSWGRIAQTRSRAPIRSAGSGTSFGATGHSTSASWSR
jgi:hypothetical protein